MSDILIPNLPATTSQYNKKYTRLAPQLSQFPAPLVSSLQQFDLARANRGSPPLSTADTARVLAAALQNRAITPPPTHHGFLDLPGNFVHDLRSITASIPKLPMALVHEVGQLPQLPTALSSALASGDPQQVAQVPGIRLIPGAYTLGNILSGHGSEILAHPLMSALDVAPVLHSVGPSLTSALGKTAAGEALGRGVSALTDQLKLTRPGQFATEMFGSQSRDLSALEAAANRRLTEELSPTPHPATGQPTPTADPLVQAARDANQLRTTFKSIPEARRVELTTLMQEDPQALATTPLTDVEHAFVDQSRQISDTLGRHAAHAGFLTDVGGELYDSTTARKLIKVQQQHNTTVAVNEARNLVLTPPDPADLDAMQAIRNKLDSANASTSMTKGTKQKLVRGYELALEHAANPVMPPEQIIEQLLPRSRLDPTVARLVETIRSEDWSSANKLAKLLNRRVGPGQLEDLTPAIDSIRRQSVTNRYLSSTSSFTDAAAERLAKSQERLIKDTPPDRFIPAIQREAQNRLLAKYSSDPNFEAITQYLHDGYYRGVPGMAEDLAKLQREVRNTWQDMKDAGINPTFISHITPSAARSIDFPRVFEAIRTPSLAKRRTMDLTPYVQDATVALPHQALQLLRRRATEEFVNTVQSTWGKTLPQLMDDYLPTARTMAAKDPRLSAAGHAENLINREYTKYDPNSIITWGGAKVNNLGQESVYLPKALAKNLERMHSPMNNAFTAITDPVMKVFRTSLLPLSPRWHFNNIIGGGMMLTAEDPAALRFLGRARQLMKQGETDIRGTKVPFPTDLPTGMVSIPKDVLEWDHAPAREFHFRGGATMARLWSSLGPARDAFNNVVSRSYAANAFFDDLYRSAAYLSGTDKALAKGLSRDEAIASGMSLAKKTFQQWDRMTPLERTIMRSVFPFYGWVSHVMKYAYHYPFDHPTRAAITSAFARNEVADMGTGLPDKFMSSFFLGKPDAKGNVRAIETSGLNPFRDVANYATWAGFTSALNPIGSSVLKVLGVDTSKGAPELYPTLEYDPDTGRLAAKRPGLLSTLLGNVLPQSQVLTGLFSSSSEFKQLLRTNPEAASRLLRSQAGLPIIFRSIPVYQEAFKSEQARNQAQSQALSSALKSGNYGEASKFPGLTPLLAQLKTLKDQGALGKYQPDTKTTPLPQLAKQALILENVP